MNAKKHSDREEKEEENGTAGRNPRKKKNVLGCEAKRATSDPQHRSHDKEPRSRTTAVEKEAMERS